MHTNNDAASCRHGHARRWRDAQQGVVLDVNYVHAPTTEYHWRQLALIATRNGHVAALQQLLDGMALANYEPPLDLLATAALQCAEGVVAFLLARGTAGHVRREALLKACRMGHVQIILALVPADARIVWNSAPGANLMSAAFRLGYDAVIQPLLDAHVHFEAGGDYPASCLWSHRTVASTSLTNGGEAMSPSRAADTLGRLLSLHSGCDLDKLLPPMLLHAEYKLAWAPLLHTVLSAKACPDTRNDAGNPALLQALESIGYVTTSEDAVRALIRAGADCSVTSPCGCTALDLAVGDRSGSLIRMLVKGKADVTSQPYVYLAQKSGNASAVRALLQCKAEVNPTWSLRGTALHVALTKDVGRLTRRQVHMRQELVRVLLKYGADVRTLLKYGADVHAPKCTAARSTQM